MRYVVNFDKTINRLIPYYIGGRKLILYLQALLKPLQQVNAAFVEYAKETRIEAAMTSQVFKFEWFLNRKLGKYFLDGSTITIGNSEHLGVPIYYGNASIPQTEHMVLYQASESSAHTTELTYQNEGIGGNNVSFVVTSPSVNTQLITQEKYEAMLRHYINRYRLSNKTYIISYTSNEGI